MIVALIATATAVLMTQRRCGWMMRTAVPLRTRTAEDADADRDGDFNSIFECLAKLRTTGRPVIACGDFNLPEIEWPSDEFPVIQRRSARAVEFLDFVHVNGITQSVQAVQ